MLFVAITCFAIWLGWEVHIVQERKEWLRKIRADGGQFAFADSVRGSIPDAPQIPWIRRLLGDNAVFVMKFVVEDESKEAWSQSRKSEGEVKAIFPEAFIEEASRRFVTEQQQAGKWIESPLHP
jgi:hypothetical protein